ncbi:hypothetical protein TYRP_016328 [Tyrophagus putrescentiae]|nr:hypothetical protein TYRP_016328 [Tyrophagus putrescentiae]
MGERKRVIDKNKVKVVKLGSSSLSGWHSPGQQGNGVGKVALEEGEQPLLGAHLVVDREGHEEGDGEGAVEVGQGDHHELAARPDVQVVGRHGVLAGRGGRNDQLQVAVLDVLLRVVEEEHLGHRPADGRVGAVAADDHVGGRLRGHRKFRGLAGTGSVFTSGAAAAAAIIASSAAMTTTTAAVASLSLTTGLLAEAEHASLQIGGDHLLAEVTTDVGALLRLADEHLIEEAAADAENVLVGALAVGNRSTVAAGVVDHPPEHLDGVSLEDLLLEAERPEGGAAAFRERQVDGLPGDVHHLPRVVAHLVHVHLKKKRCQFGA